MVQTEVPKIGSSSLDQIAGELNMQNNMVTALAEMLEERGLIDYPAWESRVKKKLVKGKKLGQAFIGASS